MTLACDWTVIEFEPRPVYCSLFLLPLELENESILELFDCAILLSVTSCFYHWTLYAVCSESCFEVLRIFPTLMVEVGLTKRKSSDQFSLGDSGPQVPGDQGGSAPRKSKLWAVEGAQVQSMDVRAGTIFEVHNSFHLQSIQYAMRTDCCQSWLYRLVNRIFDCSQPLHV